MTAPHRRDRRIQLLMFVVVATIGVGNAGMQSIMPAIGRTLRLPDWIVALTFSVSALLWSFAAPAWARRIDLFGSRTLVVTGLAGFCTSLALAAAALTADQWGLIGPYVAIAAIIVSRSFYGTLGPAAPTAAQTIVVASVPRKDRTRALTMLASGFGFGTIVGPALAPFFSLTRLGLVGPLLAFLIFGLATIAAMFVVLPSAVVAEPRKETDDAAARMAARGGDPATRRGDPRIRTWMAVGIVSAHVQVIVTQTIGFRVLDQVRMAPELAQSKVGLVLSMGAAAMLLNQWLVLPLLRLRARQMVVWGSLATGLGSLGLALASGIPETVAAYVVASVGFGMVRPGYTSAASLAVTEPEQAAVAGHVTANSGLSFVAGPTVGILLYQLLPAAPYAVGAVLSVLTALVVWWKE